MGHAQTAYAKKAPQQTQKIPMEDIRRFVTVISHIKRYYIEPIEDSALFEKALRGMVSGLDPHSMYLSEQDMKELTSSTKGEFSGLGIELVPEKGLIRVVSPIDDTPAAKAGIQAGDLIVRINNTLVKDMSLKEAIKRMRGKQGSKVTLTLIRKGKKKPVIVTLTRETIHIQTVKSRILEPGYGYVRIAFFQGPTEEGLIKAIKDLQKKSDGQLKGLILDLRNNPGGLLSSAIRVADVFLDAHALKDDQLDKLIVYTKGRIRGSSFKSRAKPGDLVKGVPIVILINNGSASGAEIVAGALKDHKRAVVMGSRSFGKGSVQTVIPIDRKTGIKLTTALYYTPAGTSIQATGIKPDIVIATFKIPKAKTEAVLFDPIGEVDLEGHITNHQKPKITKKTKETKKDTKAKNLMHTDYALYEALNLLKGLHVSRNPVKNAP